MLKKKKVCLFEGCECFQQRLSNRKVQTFRLLFGGGSLQKPSWERILILFRRVAHIQPLPCTWEFLFWGWETVTGLCSGTRFALEPCISRSWWNGQTDQRIWLGVHFLEMQALGLWEPLWGWVGATRGPSRILGFSQVTCCPWVLEKDWMTSRSFLAAEVSDQLLTIGSKTEWVSSLGGETPLCLGCAFPEMTPWSSLS